MIKWDTNIAHLDFQAAVSETARQIFEGAETKGFNMQKEMIPVKHYISCALIFNVSIVKYSKLLLDK